MTNSPDFPSFPSDLIETDLEDEDIKTSADLLLSDKMDPSDPSSIESHSCILNPDNTDDEMSGEAIVYDNDRELSDPGEFCPINNTDSTPDKISSPCRSLLEEENTGQPGDFCPEKIAPFNPDRVGNPDMPSSYEDDLRTTYFAKSNACWAGEQRKGIQFSIPDATSKTDFVFRAMAEPFHLADEIPLPSEVKASLDFIKNTAPDKIRRFWKAQLRRLRLLTRAAAPAQAVWDALIPDFIRPAAGKLKTVTISHLLHQFGLGGQSWIKQFIYGFDIVGTFSQEGLFPVDPRVKPPLPTESIWEDCAGRFRTRAAASGFKYAEELWSEALDQCSKGWLAPPVPLDADGRPFGYEGRVNNAFRFPVTQVDKIRACDDLKYGLVNPCCATRTPIKLPTWDHIGQMCLHCRDSDREWSFFKTDHAAAYKNLPLAPDSAKLCLVTLRNPEDGKWYGFWPRTLLFGAVAAVLHYNCFSRIIAILANRIFGLPMVNYFDDLGCLILSQISRSGLNTFRKFCRIIVFVLRKDKTELGKEITFLGLRGTFPSPQTDMLLSVDLTAEKKAAWASRIDDILEAGAISHGELEALTGRLSFSQTSIFGRYGRAMMQHLYRKLYAGFYSAGLTDEDRTNLDWWAGLLRSARPRIISPRRSTPQKVVITDAATETMIMAGIVFDKEYFDATQHASVCRGIRAAPVWEALFITTNLILGLELTAVVLVTADPLIPLDGQCVTYYVDNNNSLSALVKADSGRDVIAVLARIYWALCALRGITPWVERVPSDRNITDNPTRNEGVPFIIDEIADFSFEMELFRMVTTGLSDFRAGTFDPTALVGRLYPPIHGRTTEGGSGDNQQIIDFRRCG